MANIPERWDGYNQYYFVTIVTKNRMKIFADDHACGMLQQSFKEACQYYPFRMAALVIIPDHWHGLIRPGKDAVIEQVVGNVKKNLLKYLNLLKSIWQPRFPDHRIRDEDDFLYLREYIQLNPKKHGLVEEGQDYKWLFLHPRPFG